MRLIDADALIKEIHSYTMYDEISKYDIERAIDEAATVDAEPVRHGRWIDEYNGKYANPRYICSNCKGKALYDVARDNLGNYREVQVLTEHCPHCGAIMYEEVE